MIKYFLREDLKMKNSGRIILIILFALLLLSPIDPVPDVIPVVGWTDDLLYIVGIIYQVLQIVKRNELEDAEL